MVNNMFRPDEKSYYGIDPLSTYDYSDDSLTLKSPPEYPSGIKHLSLKDYYLTDTTIIKDRVFKVLTLSRSNFFDDSLPDLYCPCWVSITLSLFFLFLNNSGSSLSYALILLLMYLLLLVIPLLVYLLQPESDFLMSYYLLSSLYAYSWIFFIFSALISLVQVAWVTFLSWCLAWLLSLIFLSRSLWPEIKSSIPSKKYHILLLTTSGHSIFLLSTLLYLLIN
jgi:hypothetical protein